LTCGMFAGQDCARATAEQANNRKAAMRSAVRRFGEVAICVSSYPSPNLHSAQTSLSPYNDRYSSPLGRTLRYSEYSDMRGKFARGA
jgi:hypothetical protein